MRDRAGQSVIHLIWIGVLVFAMAAIDAVACQRHHTSKLSSGLHISEAWRPTAPPTVGVHAGYLTLTNHTAVDRVMVGASSPHYDRIEMHRTTATNGVASMEAVPTLPIAAGERVQFAPGGLHLMMMGYAGQMPLKTPFPVTFHFQNGEALTVQMAIKLFDMHDHTAPPVTDHSGHQHHKHHGK